MIEKLASPDIREDDPDIRTAAYRRCTTLSVKERKKERAGGMDPEFMTYDQAAQRLGIKPESVKRRARARKWPRRIGNDGLALVGIPPDVLGPDHPPGPPPGLPPDDGKEKLEVRLAVAEARLADVTADRDRLAALLEKALEPRPGIISRLLGLRD